MLSARKTTRIGPPPVAAQRPQRIADCAAWQDRMTKIAATTQVPAPLALAQVIPDRAPQTAERAATRNIPAHRHVPGNPEHGLPLHGPPPHGQPPRPMTSVAARTANWNAKGPGQKNVAVIASIRAMSTTLIVHSLQRMITMVLP